MPRYREKSQNIRKDFDKMEYIKKIMVHYHESVYCRILSHQDRRYRMSIVCLAGRMNTWKQ